jgi:3-phosphoshikimate 1-carboxyvinyltransferase
VVEPDASSAAYWFGAAAIVNSSRLLVPGLTLHSQQPDVPIYNLVYGGSRDGPAKLRQYLGKKFDAAEMPDASMILAIVVATVVQHTVRLAGLGTLRQKETDRVEALANELRKVGCTVETGEDWISITPPAHGQDARATEPVIIETYNDHRMAMAFGVLGLNPPGGRPLAISNPKCVAKSYPGFWKDFALLYG